MQYFIDTLPGVGAHVRAFQIAVSAPALTLDSNKTSHLL